MDKLKANMAAAKMLGIETYMINFGGGFCLGTTKNINGALISKPFNLFTNPSYLVAVVKCLGEKHGISIIALHNADGEFIGYQVQRVSSFDHRCQGNRKLYQKCEEAAAAACIATQEGEG